MQPRIKEIREKYKHDKQKMNEELMKLYQAEMARRFPLQQRYAELFTVTLRDPQLGLGEAPAPRDEEGLREQVCRIGGVRAA